jgi:hypothetical protein
MGYAFITGPCGCCHKIIVYNPIRVPSFRFNGVDKEPICEPCIIVINKERKKKGLELWPIYDDAYSSCREEELG